GGAKEGGQCSPVHTVGGALYDDAGGVAGVVRPCQVDMDPMLRNHGGGAQIRRGGGYGVEGGRRAAGQSAAAGLYRVRAAAGGRGGVQSTAAERASSSAGERPGEARLRAHGVAELVRRDGSELLAAPVREAGAAGRDGDAGECLIDRDADTAGGRQGGR